MQDKETVYIDSQKISLNFIKKEPFTGSYKGMRYQLMNDKENDMMVVIIWPEPFCFEKTPDEQKQKKSFPLTNEGKEEAVAWLNMCYKEQFAEEDVAHGIRKVH
jgi:hypothetical protein